MEYRLELSTTYFAQTLVPDTYRAIGSGLSSISDGFGAFFYFAFWPVMLAMLVYLAFRIHDKWLDSKERRITINTMSQNAMLVQPQNGQYPVARQLLESGVLTPKLLQLSMAHIMANPSHPWPSQSTQNQPQSQPKSENFSDLADSQMIDAESQAFTMPTFLQLWQQNSLPKEGFLLGFDEENEPVCADWIDLYSCIINGQSRSGKSTMLRFILSQAVIQGAKFVICDPHHGAGKDSLGQSLKPLESRIIGVENGRKIASNEEDILSMVQYCVGVAERRLKGEDTDKTPLVIIIDEMTRLLNRSKISADLTHLLGMITQETAKVCVYVIALGQQWKGAAIDTTVRDSFASLISCPARPQNLGMMVDNDTKKVISKLTVGQAVYCRIGYDHQVVKFPNCTAEDIRLIASTMPENSPNQAHGRNHDLPEVEALPDGFPKASSMVVDGDAMEADKMTVSYTWDAQQLRFIEAKQRGMTKKATLEYVLNCTANGGREYQDASTKLNEIEQSLYSCLSVGA